MPKSLWIRHVHYSLMRVGRFWLCEDLVAPCKEFGVEVATCSLSTFKRKPGDPFIPHLLYASKILPFHKVSDSRNEMRSFGSARFFVVIQDAKAEIATSFSGRVV